MVYFGSLDCTVLSCSVREFDSKGPTVRHFKVLEITFFSDTKKVGGVIKDWSGSLSCDDFPYGTRVRIDFNAVNSMPGMDTFFEVKGSIHKLLK